MGMNRTREERQPSKETRWAKYVRQNAERHGYLPQVDKVDEAARSTTMSPLMLLSRKVLDNPCLLALATAVSVVLVLAVVIIWNRHRCATTSREPESGTGQAEALTEVTTSTIAPVEQVRDLVAAPSEEPRLEVEEPVVREETFITEAQPPASYQRGEAIVVHKMPRYGDSMYYALAHQLSKSRVGSAAHRTDTAALRAEILRHLWRDPRRYRRLMLRSVESHGDRYLDLPSDDQRLERYLRDLDRFRFPPGAEVLQAAADVRGVDVVVFDEDDQVVEVFRGDPGEASGRVIGVRRTLMDGTGQFRMDRYHYDSADDVHTPRDATP